MRKHLVTVLKLVAVAALMAFVFSTIQWGDAYIARQPDGTELKVSGDILGHWDQPQVRFQPTDPTGEPRGPVQVLEPGVRGEGQIVVSPGFGTYLVNLDWPLFALGALCYLASVLFAATRWWWLLQVNDLRVSWWDATRFTWIGLFFNNVVPGQTGGDVVKGLYIMKHCHGGRMPALVSVLVDRVLGLGSLALLGAIVVLFALDDPGFTSIALGIWGVLAGVTLLGVVAFSKRIRRLVRLDDLLNKLPAGIAGILKRIDQAIYFYRGHKAKIVLWMLAGMLNHAVSVLSVVFVGMALGVGMGLLQYFVLIPVINIVSALPVGPNGWGVGEALYRFLFAHYGAAQLPGVAEPIAKSIMGTRGVALSVLYRAHLTVWSLLGGLLLLFERDRVTQKDIEGEVAREQRENRAMPAAAPASAGSVSEDV